jgi:hypothetical protein
MVKWFIAWLDVNYQTAYWESVAQNEAWLNLLMELNEHGE